ncbi:MAG: hypothetical protein WCX48_09690 [Bacteroidales bacterium]
MELTYINGKVLIIFDDSEACGLLEDMHEIIYKLETDPTHVPYIDRTFRKFQPELKKLLDELNIV